MEHGQRIPECHYWERKEKHEELAWRCDAGHALGRYYMAGDKKTCPGCGSSKSGLARKTIMDFYVPFGSYVRQEAPGLVGWQPRQRYRTVRSKDIQDKRPLNSHNQICTEKYWHAVNQGMEHEPALELAVKETDAYLDAKNDEIQARQEIAEERRRAATEGIKRKRKSASVCSSERSPKKGSPNSNQANQPSKEGLHHSLDGGMAISLIGRKKGSEELSSDDGSDDIEESEVDELEEAPIAETDDSSSDESSSGSDSQ